MPQLSIIIPVLDEARNIGPALEALAPLRRRGAEVIVADGGSRDGTPRIARPLADHVIAAPRGRAAQMNAGAAIARGGTLLFLHADTRLPRDADKLIDQAISRRGGRAWGRFDLRISGRNPLLALVAYSANVRSRLTGIATGDQAIFIARKAFKHVGGYQDLPLMEDIVICKQLKRISRPVCINEQVLTSGRRWKRDGVLRTILLMWQLRLAYFFGTDPATLARRYGYVPRDN
jgi:rSAM/selenodomain-associated transferase 2